MQFYKSGTQKRADESKLTPRQREILQLLAEGHPVKEIAGDAQSLHQDG